MKHEELVGLARRLRHHEVRQAFRWDLPPTFNFGADVVDRWARDGDRIALVHENAAGEVRSFRYSDIALLSNRLAGAMEARGLQQGDRVIVMLPRIPEWQIAMVACLKLGLVAIPCIEMLTERDLAYRIENSGARGVICRGSEVGKLAGHAHRLAVRFAVGGAEEWTSFEEAIASGNDSFPARRLGLDEPALMYYTSGSTGHPKGVLHATRALHAWRTQAYLWLDLTPEDRIWCTADTGWSKAGTSIIWGPWSVGATAFFYDGPYVPADRLRLLEKHKVSVYCAASTELSKLAGEDVKRYDLSALRRTVSAGEAVSPAVAQRWRAATGLDIAEAYGQTEALMMLLNYPSEPIRTGSMGLPQPGLEIDIVDDQGRRLGPGIEGHIALLTPSPQLMLGYWQDPVRTAECFVDGPDGRWYLSGDRGLKDEDGYYWYRGRSDDVINSAGYRIGPLEVENALLEHPAVAECAVVPSPDAERGEIVKAFVVLRAGHAPSDALIRALQEHVKGVTAPYKYPRAIAFIDALPQTVTGKVRRKTLKDQELARAATTAGLLTRIVSDHDGPITG